MAKDQIVLRTTTQRLPLYYRYLRMLHDTEKSKVSSTKLSGTVQVDSVIIRRDSSYFGELGKRGYGYDVEDLISFFAKTLNEDELANVALIGTGNLGSTLLKYKSHQSNSIRVSCAFDVNKDIVGRIVDGTLVYPMEGMTEQVCVQQIEVVILTIPARKAQKVVNKLARVGVKGTLNFTATRLVTPPEALI